MPTLSRLLARIETVFDWLAAAAMLLIMTVVVCDTILRYAFNSPLSWAYDLISIYLVAGVFFFSLAGTYSAGAHVNVDILQKSLPPKVIDMTEVVTAIIGVLVFALIAEAGTRRTIDAFVSGDVLSGAIGWPTWPAQALVPLGCGLLVLRLALMLVGRLLNLVTGREIVRFRRPQGHEGMGFE